MLLKLEVKNTFKELLLVIKFADHSALFGQSNLLVSGEARLGLRSLVALDVLTKAAFLILGILVLLLILILLFLLHKDVIEPINKSVAVVGLVHALHDSFPHPFLDLGVLNLYAVFIDFCFTFSGVSFSLNLFQHLQKLVLDMHLHISEVFITLVFEDLGKKRYFVILSEISLDTCDDGTRPFYNESLKTVFLVEISIHILLHRLDWQETLAALLVIFDFLRVHVSDDVFELLEWQDFGGV